MPDAKVIPIDEQDDDPRSKSLPLAMRRHWAQQVVEWADARFGRDQWTQAQLGELFGVAQGVMSDMLKKHKGIGVRQVIRSSKLTNRTINDLLGLEYPNVDERDLRLMVTKTYELMDMLAKNFAFGGRPRELIDEVLRIAKRSPYFLLPLNPATTLIKSVEPKPRSRSRHPKKKAANE